ncbi:hypothetical protein [Nocardioides aurantiacus]|uniref:Uncharacterized protein n=1 Tax=Nocardioides aurantiacus TaxID=86796 RepID=A0A3N2CTR8_9ACTN|nr:hypothetical protein [Nocardioides aurantiacus]ROR90846.1 hypothetical protein EDD33_1694 [Nocardioides aurantiacus]
MPRSRWSARAAVALLRVWWWAWVVGLVAAGTLGSITLGAALVLATFLTAWALVGLNAVIVAYATGRDPHRTVVPALLVAAAVPLLAGSVELLGPWTLAPWALVVLTTPPSWERLRRHLRTQRPSGSAPSLHQIVRARSWRSAEADDARPLPRGPGQLSGCTTRRLVRLWLATSRELGRRTEPTTLDLLLDLRRACLDELERRDPTGVQRWLASGDADALGRFVHERVGEQGSDPRQ